MSRLAVFGFLLAVAGCSGGSVERGVPVDLGRTAREDVLRFYLGSFVRPNRVDSILVTDGGFRLDLDRLGTEAPRLAERLARAGADGRIDMDELQAAVRSGQAERTDLPETRAEMAARTGYGSDDGEWLVVTVRGAMSPYERRLYVREDAVESAIRNWTGSEARLVYPVGTTVVGEHLSGGEVVETTAMIRRADGFWDFVAFGADGGRVDRIDGDPEPLAVPTECFGCHYGTRLFEPEKSFPAQPPDGPHGPRFVRAPDDWIRPDVVTVFDEHRRRDDGLLGLYATLLVGRWVAQAERGALPDERLRLLADLGL